MSDYQTEEYGTGQGYRLDYIQTYTSCYNTYKSLATDQVDLYDDLIKVNQFFFIKLQSLNVDRDFPTFYNLIKEKEGIFQDFTELENVKKIEILIKIFYFTKDQKEQMSKMVDKLKFEKEELLKRQELILKEKEDNIKQRVNYYKC
jgi:hypothetical protein